MFIMYYQNNGAEWKNNSTESEELIDVGIFKFSKDAKTEVAQISSFENRAIIWTLPDSIQYILCILHIDNIYI